MTENAKKFAEMVSADEKIKAELVEKLTGKDEKEQKELLLAFAKEKGFELEESDLVWSEGQCENEVDNDELSQVAGGEYCLCIVGGNGALKRKDKCPCAFLGAGDASDCMCIIVGVA